MPSPGLSELVTTTLRKRSGKLADNVTKNNALLYKLKSDGNSRPADGGRSIVEELMYAENQTFRWYSGYEVVDIRPSDVMSAAEYSWKQAVIAVTISGLEELQNSGKSAIIKLMANRVLNAERTFMNNMSTAIYSDGTGDGGKQLGGLQLIVPDTGLGTVGGIDASTWAFWQSQVFDFSDNSLTASATTIQTAMNRLYLAMCRNGEHPNLIVADNTYYRFYMESLQPNQRHTNAKMADAGFQNLEYMGKPVVLDGGDGGSAPGSHMYMLDTNYLFFRPHTDRNMVPIGGDRMSVNQDATVKLTGFAGNMTCSNRNRQGVIVD